MIRLNSPVPLRWSALKWRCREWRIDRSLRSQEGRDQFLSKLTHQSAALSVNRLLLESLQLDGDVIECGVFRGESLLRFACTMKQAGSMKRLYGFDSFEGFPDNSVGEVDVSAGRFRSRIATKFKHVDHVPDRIHRLCSLIGFENVELIRGYFEDTLPQLWQARFCFVHLDVDLYSSYQTCLQNLYDRVVPGGLIVFDEYHEKTWPGATAAIDEFFRDKAESPEFLGTFHNPKYFVRKQDVGTVAEVA